MTGFKRSLKEGLAKDNRQTIPGFERDEAVDDKSKAKHDSIYKSPNQLARMGKRKGKRD